MIGIRADANDIVATGHIMRCITIAKQIKKLGEEVIFFLADGYGVSMLEDNGLSYIIMHTDWESPLEEIPVLAEEIKRRNIKSMLFDSYRMTKEYFMNLREKLNNTVKFAYIDDLFEEVYPVDMLVNYNAYYSNFPYESAYSESQGFKKTLLCLGTQFVPLREEFGTESLGIGQKNSVLLSCGGGDVLQSLHGILEQAVLEERFINTVFHVIVGRFHQKKELLEQLALQYKNIILYHDVKNMAELMEQCQIAVSAAGTMLYELCAMERPTVFFITADNQRYDSDFFAEENRMFFAGDIRTDRQVCIGKILDGIDGLLKDEELCIVMKEKLRQVTDGRGAERIAQMIVSLT